MNTQKSCEETAKEVYRSFPRFEAGNQVNKPECVKLITKALQSERTIALEWKRKYEEAEKQIDKLKIRLNDEIAEAMGRINELDAEANNKLQQLSAENKEAQKELAELKSTPSLMGKYIELEGKFKELSVANKVLVQALRQVEEHCPISLWRLVANEALKTLEGMR